MGTRHLTLVHLDGTYPIAQYGQWDGYPGGQGLEALKFARDKLDRARFIEKCRAAKEASEEHIASEYRKAGHKGGDWVSLDVADKFNAANPQLSRDTGAEILALVQDAPDGILLRRNVSFAGDSLFCEWAWLIDLDRNTFEAYGGFNTSPLPDDERFAHLQKSPTEDGKPREYYPVKKLAEWRLDALPTNEEFLAAFEENESD